MWVRLSNGSDGFPAGYPVESHPDPQPGLNVEMTAAEIAALQAQHASAVAALHASRAAAAASAAVDQRLRQLLDEPDERALARLVYRHERTIRALIRALRATSTAANNAANNAGLPPAAQSQDIDVAAFLAALRALHDQAGP